jgi:hypothetical protein
MVMKVYVRSALALLSCGTALVLVTGVAAAHTSNHASTAAQAEAVVVELNETGDVAAGNVQSQLNDQTPAVAQTEDEDDTDEDDTDEDGEVENLAPDRQPAPAAAGTHANEGVNVTDDKAEGSDG